MTGTAGSGTIELLAQYVRDLSFEHPNAPHSLNHAQDAVPSVDVRVTYRQIDATTFESLLTVVASAKAGDVVVAVIEVTYAGTYRVPAVVSEMREAFLMVNAPRDLFPFARAIIGLITQSAGIPPLLVAAPDFQDTYRRSLEKNLVPQAAS